MKLIFEAENTEIGINDKMTTLDQAVNGVTFVDRLLKNEDEETESVSERNEKTLVEKKGSETSSETNDQSTNEEVKDALNQERMMETSITPETNVIQADSSPEMKESGVTGVDKNGEEKEEKIYDLNPSENCCLTPDTVENVEKDDVLPESLADADDVKEKPYENGIEDKVKENTDIERVDLKNTLSEPATTADETEKQNVETIKEESPESLKMDLENTEPETTDKTEKLNVETIKEDSAECNDIINEEEAHLKANENDKKSEEVSGVQKQHGDSDKTVVKNSLIELDLDDFTITKDVPMQLSVGCIKSANSETQETEQIKTTDEAITPENNTDKVKSTSSENIDENTEKSKNDIINLSDDEKPTLRKEDETRDNGDTTRDVTTSTASASQASSTTDSHDDIIFSDQKKSATEKTKEELKDAETKPTLHEPEERKDSFKLSNTLDILSDDEDAPQITKPCSKNDLNLQDKQTINLDDDDDIMLIDDDTSLKDEDKTDSPVPKSSKQDEPMSLDTSMSIDLDPKDPEVIKEPEPPIEKKKECVPLDPPTADTEKSILSDKPKVIEPDAREKKKTLVPENFFKTYKKNLADMTREDLEEFCVLKIVESIIDRSSLNETKTKLKALAQSVDEYKKKAITLTKQNRDLQVVLKSVQEEQKKRTNTPISPLKITRSVGMQVLMTDKNRNKKVPTAISTPSTNSTTSNTNSFKTVKVTKTVRPLKLPNTPQIPVPRLVPAPTNAKVAQPAVNNNSGKTSPMTNGVKSSPPVQKAEKRTHSRMQSQSVTVDLTDDEPLPKLVSKPSTPATPPVRLVPSQNLMAARPTYAPGSSPRKVFIPISGPGQQLKPGQTIMVKSAPPGQRPRQPGPASRVAQNPVRLPRVGQNSRHPAPLPDAMKQYQPPNWKALPPAPDLKLSKVENGIVISWKIEGYQEDSYEEIASYQLFAYQETSLPPSTSLWKKIGDVKALPLPMACTLTQFMAGYKYYFAVRAVDIRSRLGPFSLPGSILLLNKM